MRAAIRFLLRWTWFAVISGGMIVGLIVVPVSVMMGNKAPCGDLDYLRPMHSPVDRHVRAWAVAIAEKPAATPIDALKLEPAHNLLRDFRKINRISLYRVTPLKSGRGGELVGIGFRPGRSQTVVVMDGYSPKDLWQTRLPREYEPGQGATRCIPLSYSDSPEGYDSVYQAVRRSLWRALGA